jgi:E3 ubiquitin-protein ligase RNF115/126
MPCKHCFHPACLEGWLARQNTCPVCRTELEAEGTFEEDENGVRTRVEPTQAGGDAAAGEEATAAAGMAGGMAAGGGGGEMVLVERIPASDSPFSSGQGRGPVVHVIRPGVAGDTGGLGGRGGGLGMEMERILGVMERVEGVMGARTPYDDFVARRD